MFAIETKWYVEEYLTMLRITARSKIDNINISEQVVQPLLVQKMLKLIDASTKFRGKLIANFPRELPKEDNTMDVYVCMIFESDSMVENFKKEIPKVLQQG